MGCLARLGGLRFAVVVLAAMTALQMTLIAFGNITERRSAHRAYGPAAVDTRLGDVGQMWQSEKWNGLQNFLIASVALVVAHLPEKQAVSR